MPSPTAPRQGARNHGRRCPATPHSFREFSNCGERASKLFGNRHENGGSNGSLLAP
jgi:hypothetical protein